MAFLCVDIGGTNTLIGFGNDEFKVVEKYSSRDFVQNIDRILEEVVENSDHSIEDVEEVAVAAAGPIDHERGVFFPPNMGDIEEVQIYEPFQKFGELTVVNDCTSAVAGEYFYGETKADNMIYITISSGIGAGVVSDGKVIEGWDGNAGEVGHMKLGNGVECGCGGEGHWEAFCSGNQLPKAARKMFDAEFDDAVEIFEKYHDGHEDAKKVIRNMQEYNALGLTNMINIYNPEVVWVGGAVALNHYDTVIEEVLDDVEDEIVTPMPEFDTCSLGDEAVLHGLRAVCNGEFEPRN